MSYGKYWDEFYRKTYLENGGKALWDVPVSESVEADHRIFGGFFPIDLPLIDIGCGSGEQAEFLAGIYPEIVAVDAAPTAVEIARENHPVENIEFTVLDITDEVSCRELSDKYGDLNIYMRGVMHQIDLDELSVMINNLSILMGEKGIAYIIEVRDKIREYFLNSDSKFTELPKQMLEVFVSNLPPRGLSSERMQEYFPNSKFELLETGSSSLLTNLSLPDGSKVEIPALYAVIKAR